MAVAFCYLFQEYHGMYRETERTWASSSWQFCNTVHLVIMEVLPAFPRISFELLSSPMSLLKWLQNLLPKEQHWQHWPHEEPAQMKTSTTFVISAANVFEPCITNPTLKWIVCYSICLYLFIYNPEVIIIFNHSTSETIIYFYSAQMC